MRLGDRPRGRSRPRRPSRWGDGPSPIGHEQWERDAHALQASRHEDPRRIVDGEPALRPGETVFFSWIGEPRYRLLEVEGYGFRLIACPPDGPHLAWELPGFNGDDAYRLCLALQEGYLARPVGVVPPEPPPLVIGDQVLVIRWLMLGTPAGPFPIVGTTEAGSYVVAFGGHASYTAELPRAELVPYAEGIEAKAEALVAQWRAQKQMLDAELRSALLNLVGPTGDRRPLLR